MAKSKYNKMTVVYTDNGNGVLKLTGDEPAVMECIHAFAAGRLIASGSLVDTIRVTFLREHVLGQKGDVLDVLRPLAAALISRNIVCLSGTNATPPTAAAVAKE